jgi:hypothetical protein
MKLFGRTGGYYMFWISALYLAVGMYCVFVNKFVPDWVAQVTWLALLVLPFAIPPFGRWLNMSMPWDRKEPVMPNNVVPFPEPKLTPVPEPEPEEHYRVGFTTAGDTTLTLKSLGGASMTLTMNRDSTEQLIRMLRATYQDEDENGR